MTIQAPAYAAVQPPSSRLDTGRDASYQYQPLYQYHQAHPISALPDDNPSTYWPSPTSYPATDAECQYHSGYVLHRTDSGYHALTPPHAGDSINGLCRHDSPYLTSEAGSSPVEANCNEMPFARQATMGGHGHTRTISLNDVQRHADVTCEMPARDDHFIYSQGYCPMSGPWTASPAPSIYQYAYTEESPPTPESFVESQVIRSRRPPRSTITVSSSRVSKRQTPRRASAIASRNNNHTSDSDEESVGIKRPFHCPLAPYGCDADFGSKNEWKRHFSTQHMRLGFWRCDQCPCTGGRGPNDFNRKDLFVQHVRRMHFPKAATTSNRKKSNKIPKHNDTEAQVLEAAERCHKKVRTPPMKSKCVICEQRFSGHGSWEERMEHIGRHFEEAKKEALRDDDALDPEEWKTDVDVEDWMITQHILKVGDDGRVVVNDDRRE